MNQEKLRIGILSTAEIAHKVCLAIQNSSNACVVAVASRSLEKAQKWAVDHGIPQAFGSYDELIQDPNIDAIYIPLPTTLKTEWALKASNNKKHILLEKPLPGANTDKEVRQIIEACKTNQVQFLDGTMWLHSLRTQDIKAKKETLGKILQVNAAFTFMAPSQEWLEGGNGRTNSKQEPQGCLGDQGWYPVSAILFAFDYELPKSVRCIFVKKNKVNTIIQFIGFLEFSDGRTAYFDCGVTSPHRSYFEIVGEKGVIRVDDQVGGQGRSGNFDAYFINFVGSGKYYIDDISGKESVVQVEECNHTIKMIEEFAKCSLSKQPKEEWPLRSLNTHIVLSALYKSVEEGNSIIEIQQKI